MNKYLGTLTQLGIKTNPQTSRCFVCLEKLSDKPIITTSFVAENGEFCTYFFWVHKDCGETYPKKNNGNMKVVL